MAGVEDGDVSQLGGTKGRLIHRGGDSPGRP
jgi:hypothetical protein